MPNNKSPKKRFSKKYLLATVICIVVIIGIVFKLKTYRSHNAANEPITKSSGINLNPPTDKEKAETEAHKNNLGQTNTPTTTNADGKKQVTPVITSADKQEVSAYISGVFEEGGTCTATLTKDGKTVTKTSKGFGNVSYTSCEPITVDGSLDKGSWTVVVTYSSSAAEGTSQSKVFTVE